MFRKLLEMRVGPMTDAEFRQVLDLTGVDIKVNRISFDRKTSLTEAVQIAEICFSVIKRAA